MPCQTPETRQPESNPKARRRLEDLARKGIDADSTSDGAVARIACVADPDGNRVVFAEGVGSANRSAST